MPSRSPPTQEQSLDPLLDAGQLVGTVRCSFPNSRRQYRSALTRRQHNGESTEEALILLKAIKGKCRAHINLSVLFHLTTRRLLQASDTRNVIYR